LTRGKSSWRCEASWIFRGKEAGLSRRSHEARSRV
jgi:hypothetical protein